MKIALVVFYLMSGYEDTTRCRFDNEPISGNLVVLSNENSGYCHDTGIPYKKAKFLSKEVIGYVK